MQICANTAFIRLLLIGGLLTSLVGYISATAQESPSLPSAIASVGVDEGLAAVSPPSAPVNIATVSPSDLPPIVVEANSPTSSTDAAIEALAKIGVPALPRVKLLLQDPHPRVRQRGAEILAKMGPPARRAMNELIYLLNDQDTDVRIAAAQALGSIGSEAASAVPALIEQVAHQP